MNYRGISNRSRHCHPLLDGSVLSNEFSTFPAIYIAIAIYNYT